MRELLFKGKQIKSGDWIEGYFLKRKDKAYICTNPYEVMNEYSNQGDSFGFAKFFEVDPETVCQYTGLTDKNGKKIFEGDIISGKRYRDYGQSGEFVDDKEVVKWNDKKCGFDPIRWFDGYSHDIKHYEVIGNIFDNPELLSKQEVQG